MPPILTRVRYEELNARQQESYNYQKIAAVLADYGFVTMRLSDDWQGADFIAQHKDGEFLKVQLKGRLSFREDYRGKNLYIAFPDNGEWYLYPHDQLLSAVLSDSTVASTVSWKDKGGYSFPYLTPRLQEKLAPYKIGGASI